MRGLHFRSGAGPMTVLCALMSVGAAAAESRGEAVETYPGQQYESLFRGADALDASHHITSQADRLRYWNQVAVDSSGLDHTPVEPGENRVFGHQLGPGRSSRAMAIVHIAMADSVAAILGGFRRYSAIPNAPPGSSVDTAVATAAHHTLVAMFPSHAHRLHQLYILDLQDAPGTVQQKAKGVLVGTIAAGAILVRRAHDGSHHAEPLLGVDYVPGLEEGVWRQDPISQLPVALGARWAEVRPFVLASASQFRTPPLPPMNTPQYATAFDEVQRLGGDGIVTPTERSEEQTQIGIYWAYDGTPSLCAPPRLYNQIANKLFENETDVRRLARMYALINVSMADAGIAIWESKYFYKFWRPVAGIRESDPGTGPLGHGDGNPATVGDPQFSPLGAPASNTLNVNFTPPFPAYPSGHAGFGGALFQTMRRLLGTDAVAFTFTSDELNGETLDNNGVVRPLVPRSFASLSQAEEENGQSRIYLGIHWSFDKTEGILQGRRVADWVFTHAFQPLN